MSKNSGLNLDEYLFKPVIYSTEYGDKLVIMFAYDSITEHILNASGNLVKKKLDAVKFLDVFKTIEVGQAVIETSVIDDKRGFKDKVRNVEVHNFLSELLIATTIVVEEVTHLESRLDNMKNLVATIRKISVDFRKDFLPEEGRIHLQGSSEPLANIVFKTINGEKIDLPKLLSASDVAKIGQVIIDVIMSHLDKDLENPEFLKRLKAEIEYKIVESLPSTVKAGDINVNLDAVVQEIKRFRDMDRGDLE